MKCLVTGAAGFIGSNLSKKLLSLGYDVTGIDSFSDYYPRKIKEANIAGLLKHKKFSFVEGDLNGIDIKKLASGASVIFHKAAQPGVRKSWGSDFSIYIRDNIRATQRLLENVKDMPLDKLIYASSSSVYGDIRSLPMKEASPTRPVSPYGVTKLAAEHLCYLYHKNFGLPFAALRYFTVYGPGQRPDMAFHMFLKHIILNEEIIIFGDGKQTRDYTFISDVVQANIRAMDKNAEGGIYNIGGHARITVLDVLDMLRDITGKKIKVKFIEKQKGDMKHTYSDITRAKKYLKYSPDYSVKEGLKEEYKWLRSILK